MNGCGNKNTLDEFYRICDSIIPDEYGCLLWKGRSGTLTIRGWHQIKINSVRYKVHRLALERKLGRPIRLHHLACHHCDTPSCVNPEHLYEGSELDNHADRG